MGFIIGYLCYDMVHYYTHHAQPTTRLGKTLRRLHLLHHFRDPTRGFGVSAPWWDYVFGTQHVRNARDPADKARRRTRRMRKSMRRFSVGILLRVLIDRVS